MVVTSTKLKTNLGKYLDLAEQEDIVITRNGHQVAKLVRTEDERLSALRFLYGCLAVPGVPAPTDEEVKEIITDYIITRNAKHFAASPVPAVTPEELLNL